MLKDGFNIFDATSDRVSWLAGQPLVNPNPAQCSRAANIPRSETPISGLSTCTLNQEEKSVSSCYFVLRIISGIKLQCCTKAFGESPSRCGDEALGARNTAQTETVRPTLQANRSCSGSWPDP